MSIGTTISSTCLIHPLVDTANTGNNLYVMRDDLLPFALGGNKARIALAFVEDMLALGKTAMVAYGSASSNMCRAIANLCCAYDLPCTVILSASTEEQPDTNNKRLMDIYGARRVPCTTGNVAETVRSVLEDYRAQGLDPYYIFGNELGKGNEHVATRAYANAYQLIAAWSKEHQVSFDRIMCASGTQSTQAGLICGHLQARDDCAIDGIMISSRSTERAREALLEGCLGYLKQAAADFDQADVESAINLIDTERRGGYGIYDQTVLDCIKEQLRVNGMPLDPIYSGKAFLGMQRYLVENEISGKNILFIHTGGEPIFYDCLQSEELA